MQVAACIRGCVVRLFSGIPSYRFGRFILVNRLHHTTLAVSRRRHSWTPGSGSDPADRNRDTGRERVIRIRFWNSDYASPLWCLPKNLTFRTGVVWVMGPMPFGLGPLLFQRLPPRSRRGLPEPSSRGQESPRGVSDFTEKFYFLLALFIGDVFIF